MANNEIYLDLIEKSVYEWINSAFKMSITSEKTEHLCLVYADNINGQNKCCLLYLDIEYPPFDKVEINIFSKNSFEKTKFLWNALVNITKHFISSVTKTMDKKSVEFLNNIGIAAEPMCMNLSFYPLDENIIKNKYFSIYPNKIAIEETNETKKSLFQWYVKKIPRLSINVLVSDDRPPSVTHTDLLSNYISIE